MAGKERNGAKIWKEVNHFSRENKVFVKEWGGKVNYG